MTWIQEFHAPGCFFDRRDDPLHFRMIATDLTREMEDEGSVDRDHQDASLLKAVPLHAFVFVTGEECAEIVPNGARMNEAGYAAPEARQVVSPPGGVDVHLNIGDPQILPK